MGVARGMFDEAKHPRGFHGRFGSGGRGYSVRNVGKKGVSRVDMPWVAKAGKAQFGGGGSRHSTRTSSMYSVVPGRRVRAITYQQAAHRLPSGKVIVDTAPFVNLGNGREGRGLMGTQPRREYLFGTGKTKGFTKHGRQTRYNPGGWTPAYGGRHRARDVMGR